MDFGNKMVKESLIDTKDTTNKVKKIVDSKNGCIKSNDYFAF